MFGRRRHRARAQVALPTPVEAPTPAPQLSEEQLFDVVRDRLDEFLGAQGEWTLVRRSAGDTDEFFQSMTAFSVARDVTSSILATARGELAGAKPADQTSTVTLSDFVGFGASALQPASISSADSDEFVTRPVAEQVTFELNAIAVWADPQRHDPGHVNPDLVTPPAASIASASKTRAS